jgi:parvulin-like peptidyl-prolyl isomerase
MTAAEFDHLIEIAVPERVRMQMGASVRGRLADSIVDFKVKAREAERLKLDETPAYKTQMALASQQILAQQYTQHLTATTKVDEATARKYYDDHKADYLQVKARHILIKITPATAMKKEPKDPKDHTDEEALAKIKAIRQKLVDGADFETLAKAESEDPGSASKGGDLGTFGKGRMAAPFEEVAFTIPVGQLSEPVKTQFGYHLIKVESRQEKTFVEVRAEIERKLDGELVKKTIDDLKAATPVVRNPDYFVASAPPMMAPGARPTITAPPQAAPPTATPKQ